VTTGLPLCDHKKKMMKAIEPNISLIDSYLGLLGSLSTDSKLELISRLTASMRADKGKERSLASLYGSFNSDETADEIIEDLKRARHFGSKREEL